MPLDNRVSIRSFRLRLAIWIVAIAGILLGESSLFYLLRGNRVAGHDRLLFAGQLFTAGVIAVFMILLRSTPPGAWKLSRSASNRLIVGGALLLQLSAFLPNPILSDDALRYRHDGRMWLSGNSPYAVAPLEWKGPRDGIDGLLPHQEYCTIYPPVAEAIFTVAAIVERTIWQDAPPLPQAALSDTSPWRSAAEHVPFLRRLFVLRCLSGICAIVTTCLMLRALAHQKISAWWAVLFAWNPLVVLETSGMAHVDILAAMFLLLTVLAIQRQKGMSAGLALACATGVKPFAVLLLPFLWRDLRGESGFHVGRRVVLSYMISVAVLFIPPLLLRNGYVGWARTSQAYSQLWEGNGSIYEVVRWYVSGGQPGALQLLGKDLGRLTAIVATAATLGILWQARATVLSAGYWLYLIILLFAPVVYPWYLIWPLCFVPLLAGRSGWSVIIWSGTAVVSYQLWHQPIWRLPLRMAMLEYLPVYIAVCCEVTMRMSQRNDHAENSPTPIVAPLAGSGSV
jgi:alpha-1,6-mannosyltransferase